MYQHLTMCNFKWHCMASLPAWADNQSDKNDNRGGEDFYTVIFTTNTAALE